MKPTEEERRLYQLDSNEEILHHIRKHPIGLLPIVGGGALVLFGLLFVVVFIATSESFQETFPIPVGMATLFALGLGFLVALMTYISYVVYRRNELVITSEAVVQVLQTSLFSRKISQLSLANVQDVTVDQNGILPHMFNFGTLYLETPGETKSFGFTFVSNPHDVSQSIVEAHESFIELHPDAPMQGGFRRAAIQRNNGQR